jgi:UDP-GlcNAc:undecaprenyl-phosphate GlcNAc-1-phosphate transferase
VEFGGWRYFIIFLAAAGTSLVLTPVALRLALRWHVLDRPGGHKSHTSPVPYLGGLAIVTAFAAVVIVATFVSPPVDGRSQLAAILGTALALSTLGLIDDLRGLSAIVRLAVQVTAAAIVWKLGIQVDLFVVPTANFALTVLWVVGVTNAFNFIDNMDGLAAGIATIAGLSLWVIAAQHGQFLVAGLSIAIAGCALGFLRENFHPARVYMGDAGSLFLGFMLAVLGLKLKFDAPPEVTFFVPILVLGVAIFDMALVVAGRLTHGRSVFVGGRDHISHRLVALGMPVRAAVGVVYAAGVATGWLALVMSRIDRGTGFVLMGFAIAAAIFFGLLLSLVPVYGPRLRRRLVVKDGEGQAGTADDDDGGDPAHLRVPCASG